MFAFLHCTKLRKSWSRRGIVCLWLGVLLATVLCAVPRHLEGEAAVGTIGEDGIWLGRHVQESGPSQGAIMKVQNFAEVEAKIFADAWGYPYVILRQLDTRHVEDPFTIVYIPSQVTNLGSNWYLSLSSFPANAFVIFLVVLALLSVVLYCCAKKPRPTPPRPLEERLFGWVDYLVDAYGCDAPDR